MIFLGHISFTNRCNIRWTTPWRKPMKLPKGIQKVQVPSHLSPFHPVFRVTLPENRWFGRRSGFLLRRLIFRCYVSFWEGISFLTSIHGCRRCQRSRWTRNSIHPEIILHQWHLALMVPLCQKPRSVPGPVRDNVRKHIPNVEVFGGSVEPPICKFLFFSQVYTVGNLSKFPSIGLKCFFSLGDVGCFLVCVHRVQPPNHIKSHGWGSKWGHDEQNLGFSCMEVYCYAWKTSPFTSKINGPNVWGSKIIAA